MISDLPLDSASRLLTSSNAIYVFGAVLTLGSAAMVLYEKRSIAKGFKPRWGLAPELMVIIAAFVSLLGTIGAIYFGSLVGKLKDAERDTKIASANADAAKSIQEAVAAQLEIEKMKPSISTLQADQRATSNSVQLIQTRSNPRYLVAAPSILNRLKRFNDPGIHLEADLSDREAHGLEQQLGGTLVAAGFKPSTGVVLGPGAPSLINQPGVHILYQDGKDTRAISETVAALLKKSNLAFDLQSVNSDNPQYDWAIRHTECKVLILVGSKPYKR